MRIRFNKRGFTLAEIMIVLMVIGIISAILLPVARHATPDENVLKFKKANATLGNVIRELVTSDKYYLDGDLGVKPDGSLVDSPTYFCETFADLVNAKSVNCADTINNATAWVDNGWNIVNSDENYCANVVDSMCKKAQETTYTQGQIMTADSVIWFEGSPAHHFGYSKLEQDDGTILDTKLFYIKDENFFRIYKTFCIDIDEIDSGEDPFGYGIRADGKILYGARAQEWMQKGIQSKE